MTVSGFSHRVLEACMTLLAIWIARYRFVSVKMLPVFPGKISNAFNTIPHNM